MNRWMKTFAAAAGMFGMLFATGYADNTVAVYLNDRPLQFDQEPVILEDRTLVPIRTVAEEMDCDVVWEDATKTVTIINKDVTVRLQSGIPTMTVENKAAQTTESVVLEVSPTIIGDRICLPLRAVAEALGATIQWDHNNRIIYATYDNGVEAFSPHNLSLAQLAEKDNTSTFYFQNDQAWQLPNYGSGYCWVCCYAMLLTDVTQTTVTPVDVAKVNLTKSGSGAYCYHSDIVSAFHAKFACALGEGSPYLGSYNAHFGATYIKNPEQSDQVAIDAIKEALDRNPAGIMVRFENYPHTVVAVGYQGNEIYFNEPAQTSSGYDTSSNMHYVPYEQTIMAKRGYNIASLTYLQAIVKN